MSDPIVIVGSGMAAYAVCREFRKLNKEQSIFIITEDDGAVYSKPMLSTGFTKAKTADDLATANAIKSSSQLDISVRTRSSVTAIHPDTKTVTVDDEVIAYSKLVLATGAEVLEPQIEGYPNDKIFSINSLEDYRKFRAGIEGKKRVVIAGTGLIGCEYANDLLEGGFEVNVVGPSRSLLDRLIPQPAGQCLQQGLEAQGVQFHLGKLVTKAEDKGNELIVTLDDGTTLNADALISAIGLRPRTELAKSAGASVNKGIVCNRLLETSVQDVYAIGDCAEVDGQVLLYVLPLMAGARALAKTLNGEPTQVHYGVMPVVVKTAACPVVVCPPKEGISGEWKIAIEGNDCEALYVDDTNTLQGFVLTGARTSEKQALAKQVKGLHD